MNVKLISITSNAEEVILYCARVSSDQSNTDTKLLRYLVRNSHWSPFELAHMTVEINTSRAIARQILRHRSFAFQEFSQRYATPDGLEIYDARAQAEKNRQSSVDTLDEDIKDWFAEAQKRVYEFATKQYERAMQVGIARECARILLPEGTTTKLYMCGSVRSWIHYLDLRCDEHTQLEHREIAEEIRGIFNEQFPTIAEALDVRGKTSAEATHI